MHLLLVNYEFPPIGGGAATATEKIAQSLVAQGHQVSVLTSAFDELRGESEETGASIIRIPTVRRHADRSTMFEMATFVLSAVVAMPRVVRKSKPDAMICFFSIPCGPIGWFGKFWWGIPYVVSLRGGDVPGAEGGIGWIHNLLGPLRRKILQNAVAVVANSHGLKVMSEQADPVSVCVIPNGVDSDFFVPSARRRGPGEPIRFLFVGRLNEQKNVSLLLEALALVKASGANCHLRIIGDGPLRDDLYRLGQQLALDQFVEWMGWQSRSAMPAHYGAADCLVIPSRYEGMPNVVLEAMSCGLPVLASDVAGNRDVIDRPEYGLLFKDNDRNALAAAMLRAVHEPEWLETARRLAREAVTCTYSWSTTAQSYTSFFKPMCNGAHHEGI